MPRERGATFAPPPQVDCGRVRSIYPSPIHQGGSVVFSQFDGSHDVHTGRPVAGAASDEELVVVVGASFEVRHPQPTFSVSTYAVERSRSHGQAHRTVGVVCLPLLMPVQLPDAET